MNDLATADAALLSFCTFRLEQRLHGIDVSKVREVSRSLPITPVPQSPQAVRGLVNLRSRIYLVLDPRPLFGYGALGPSDGSRLLILKPEVGQDLALLVETSGEIIHVKPEHVVPSSATGEPSGTTESSFISHVCRLPDELLLVIDPMRIVNAVMKQFRAGVQTENTSA